jgi:hypothetical protein
VFGSRRRDLIALFIINISESDLGPRCMESPRRSWQKKCWFFWSKTLLKWLYTLPDFGKTTFFPFLNKAGSRTKNSSLSNMQLVWPAAGYQRLILQSLSKSYLNDRDAYDSLKMSNGRGTCHDIQKALKLCCKVFLILKLPVAKQHHTTEMLYNCFLFENRRIDRN